MKECLHIVHERGTTHVVRVHVHVYTYHTSCVCSFPSSTLAEGLYAVHREKLLRIEFLKIALPVSNSLHLSLAVSQHEKTAVRGSVLML